MRLFVAVWPPPEVVECLRRLPRPALPGVRWTAEDQWHVTLRFLGEADPEEAGRALAGLSYGERPTAVLGPSVRRLGPGVLVAPVAGLDGPASAVAAATAGVGAPAPDRPFRGHLTLARARRRGVAWGPAAGVSVEGRWEVAEVTLVASRLHPDGARYSVVARASIPTE